MQINMKYSYLITIIILIIIALSGSLIFYASNAVAPQNQEAPEQKVEFDGGVFPLDTNTETSNSGVDNDLFNKIVSDPEVVEDAMNPGDYIVYGDPSYCLGETTCDTTASGAFTINLDSATNVLSVGLYEKPLAQSRLQAEEFLMNKFNLTAAEMCNLTYYVSTPYWVSDEYAGVDLKFSFCPGSVILN